MIFRPWPAPFQRQMFAFETPRLKHQMISGSLPWVRDYWQCLYPKHISVSDGATDTITSHTGVSFFSSPSVLPATPALPVCLSPSLPSSAAFNSAGCWTSSHGFVACMCLYMKAGLPRQTHHRENHNVHGNSYQAFWFISEKENAKKMQI